MYLFFQFFVDMIHYIFFFSSLSSQYYQMYLCGRDPTELTARERDLVSRFKRQDLDYFPILKALVLSVDKTVEEDQMAVLVRRIGDVGSTSKQQFQVLQEKLDKLSVIDAAENAQESKISVAVPVETAVNKDDVDQTPLITSREIMKE